MEFLTSSDSQKRWSSEKAVATRKVRVRGPKPDLGLASSSAGFRVPSCGQMV